MRLRRGGRPAQVGLVARVGVFFARVESGRRPIEERCEIPVAAAAILNPGLCRIERSHAVEELSQQFLLINYSNTNVYCASTST